MDPALLRRACSRYSYAILRCFRVEAELSDALAVKKKLSNTKRQTPVYLTQLWK